MLASIGLRVMDSQDAVFDVWTAEPTCKLPRNHIKRHKYRRSCSTDIINQQGGGTAGGEGGGGGKGEGVDLSASTCVLAFNAMDALKELILLSGNLGKKMFFSQSKFHIDHKTKKGVKMFDRTIGT